MTTAAEARRTRQREEFRASIVDAARTIVQSEGYGALTMRRIAEAVGYSAAAIYQYFESRDAIARALMDEAFEKLAGDFQGLAGLADPQARLRALGERYVRFGIERPATYRLMFMEDPQLTRDLLGTPTPDGAGERAYLALIAPLAELEAQGRLRPGLHAQVAADALWCALHGLVSLKLTCPAFPQTALPELEGRLLDVVLAGIVSDGA